MSEGKGARPSWHPEEPDPAFATFERPPGDTSAMARKRQPRSRPQPADLVKGIRAGDRAALARAISLVESNNRDHIVTASKIIEQLLPETGNSWRIGISGLPGAGKSTLLETLGSRLCARGKKVAVLAIDPTSPRSGGSILGDRIRMSELSRNPNAYIRPTPSGGILGGVARKTRETTLLCEAAGYDVVFVETMGVGQGEFAVREMVDCFVLLTLSGGGDEIQGIKRGILEISDILVVNKADGANRELALATCQELQRVIGFLQPATPNWQTRALALSAQAPDTLASLEDSLAEFFSTGETSGAISTRRKQQTVAWMKTLFVDELQRLVHANPDFKNLWQQQIQAINNGTTTPTQAVNVLLGALPGNGR